MKKIVLFILLMLPVVISVIAFFGGRRLFPRIELVTAAFAVALFTMLFGSVKAVREPHLKRRLAVPRREAILAARILGKPMKNRPKMWRPGMKSRVQTLVIRLLMWKMLSRPVQKMAPVQVLQVLRMYLRQGVAQPVQMGLRPLVHPLQVR